MRSKTFIFIEKNLNEIGLIFLILTLYVVFGISARGFWSIFNLQNILRDASALGFAAFGATLIIISREIDVSVGPMVAFLSIIISYLLKWNYPIIATFIITLIIGIILGCLVGILRAFFQVPSFVATLGLWSALRGLALFITNALPVSFPENKFLNFIDGEYLGLPFSSLLMIVTFIFFWFLSKRTVFGRSIYAMGGNMNSAILVGLPVKFLQVMIFVIASILATISAILLTARLGSGNAGAATGLEFDVIAAVVIGGTSLSGGKGSMLGTVLGVLVITLIGNGLVLLGINPFFQQVVRGVIIIVAVLLNMMAGNNRIFKKLR